MNVYLLIGAEEYEDTYELGIFETLDLAIQGRKDYRKAIHQKNSTFSEHFRYIVYEYELNKLFAPCSAKVVDVFEPGKTKIPKVNSR